MSKSTTLTIKELHDLKDLLELRKNLLQKQERLDLNNVINTVNNGLDPKHEEFSVSTATATAEQELVERHADELNSIEQALMRMRQGEFGVCSNCQSGIDFPRLVAYPIARRCMRCQEALELTEKRNGHQA
jgi:DnaK suppressor protein